MPAINLLLALVLWQSGQALTDSGIAEFNRGDYRAARQVLEQAPASPQAAVFLALTRAALGDCDQATQELRRQFAAGGASAVQKSLRRLSGLALAQCQLAAKQLVSAAPVIAELERDFPADADVLYVAAAYHLKAWNDAIYRMYKTTPSSYRVDQLSGEVFETQNKYGEAIAEYRKGIEKNPKALNLHFRLGRVLLMQSHDPSALEAARKEFAAELALNPFDAVAEYEVGQILASQMKQPQAAPHFERSLELRPDFTEALIAVAKVRSDSKRYSDAIALLERAIRLQPRSEAAHYSLMIAYRNAGRVVDAQRAKAQLDELQRPPQGEFTDFLKRLGEKAPPK